jgi:DNA helicase HerA-like ATPase
MEINWGQWVMTDTQKASVGTDRMNVVWKEQDIINGHILLAGGSGAGKTFNIRKIVREMVRTAGHDLRVHVFDVHDDIDIEGCSEVFFSESSNYGLNPLIVDPNPHTGGVRKAIQNFISTINKTSRQLGDRQEAVLRALLSDLYAANGFYSDRPETWLLRDGVERKYPKKYPTIEDLNRMSYYKYKAMFVGGNNKTAAKLDKVNKHAMKIQRMAREETNVENNEKFDQLKEDAIHSYTDYVTSIKSGRELDELLKFDSKTTLKSVLDRIDNLKSSGIFRNVAPDFSESNPIWRYRLKALSTDEKKMFVYFRLKELYDKALKRGPQDEIVEVIVIDEASMFMDQDPDNIISIMANEIRKFGTALVCASQAFTHFSLDFMGSTATKIILGIDELHWDKTSRQLQLDKKWLEWIIPQRTALIQMKRRVSPSDPTAKVKWFATKF